MLCSFINTTSTRAPVEHYLCIGLGTAEGKPRGVLKLRAHEIFGLLEENGQVGLLELCGFS